MPGPSASSIRPTSGSAKTARRNAALAVAPSSHAGNARHGLAGSAHRLSNRPEALAQRADPLEVDLRRVAQLERLHVAADGHHVVAPERVQQQVEPPVRHPHVVVRRDDDVTAGGQEPCVAGVCQAPSRLIDAPHGREAVAHRAREPRCRVVVDDNDIEGVPAVLGDDAGEARGEVVRPVECGDHDRRRARQTIVDGAEVGRAAWRPADGRRRRHGRRPPGGDRTRRAPRRRWSRRSPPARPGRTTGGGEPAPRAGRWRADRASTGPAPRRVRRRRAAAPRSRRRRGRRSHPVRRRWSPRPRADSGPRR